MLRFKALHLKIHNLEENNKSQTNTQNALLTKTKIKINPEKPRLSFPPLARFREITGASALDTLGPLFEIIVVLFIYHGHNVGRRTPWHPRNEPGCRRKVPAEERQQPFRQVLGEPGHFSPAGGCATVGLQALQKGRQLSRQASRLTR